MVAELRVVVHETGGPSALRTEPFELPELGPGQALVRHHAIGVNYIDTYHRSGLYPLPLPTTLGVEAVGHIERLGSAVEGLVEGQRVAYVAQTPGAYSTANVMPAERLVPLPDDITDEMAAASLLKGMTVEALVRRVYPVAAGQWVLFHAAAGGVGQLACQWMRGLGARVIATVGSDEKAEIARKNGAEVVIVYTRDDFRAHVRELRPGGVPVVYDSVGKTTFAGSLDCLEPRGTLVCFGNASGKPDPFDTGLLAQKGSLYLTRPTLYSYIRTRQELLASALALFAELRSGRVKARVAGHFPLANAADAHRALEARTTSGSLLLVP